MALSREWFAAAEIATMALPGLPATERAVQLLAERSDWRRDNAEGRTWRSRQGRGGGVEYHYSVLPLSAQAALALRHAETTPDAPRISTPRSQLAAAEMWAWFERQPDAKKAKARARLEVLEAVTALVAHGEQRLSAILTVAHLRRITRATIYNWFASVEFVDRADWLPYLAPQAAGGSREIELPDEAWQALKGFYLRLEKPNITDCIRELRKLAATAGWTLPSDRTLRRKLEALPVSTRTMLREGKDALKRMIPAQQRDRGALHALQAVNADGHKWDVMVRWPDGIEARPVMLAFQDIYSGKILSWRVDRSENWHMVRLAFGDLVERYGIPDECLLDNGRAFASKKITGGTPNRFRFKVREEEPEGLLTSLGVRVHWATPYHGQAKPIERAFRDLAQSVAKHPRFAGAYLGNSPMNKPANYGASTVPLDTFMEVVAEGIAEHNTRTGRTGGICRGRSFDQTFGESYAESLIRQAGPEQRRLWLLAAEAVSVRMQDGSIHFQGNRYWADWLWSARGRKVTVRFDPELLQEPLHVYRSDGAYLGAADCVEPAGFFSVEDAQKHARRVREILRAEKARAEAEAGLSIDQLAAALERADRAAPPSLPRPAAVRLVHGNTALQPISNPDDDERPDPVMQALIQASRQRREAQGLPPLALVASDEDPEDVS